MSETTKSSGETIDLLAALQKSLTAARGARRAEPEPEPFHVGTTDPDER